jgi:hypothetical protein
VPSVNIGGFEATEEEGESARAPFDDPHAVETAVGSGARLERLAHQDESDWDGEETKPGASSQ